MSGFHSPVERECLRILLDLRLPFVLVLARGAPQRLPADVRSAIDAGLAECISPFSRSVVRPTTATAYQRNMFVAEMSDSVLVPYASPGGKTEALCTVLVANGKRLVTFESVATQNLIALGATVIQSVTR